MGFVVPTLVAGLGWGDYYGGFFIAGVARLVVVHHSTFCVNSLAHFAGGRGACCRSSCGSAAAILSLPCR